VDAKYGGAWDGWCSLDPPGYHGVGLWKYIRKGWSLSRSHTRFILGHGSRNRFWHDVWCGEMTLKEAFSVLYGIARDKDAPVYPSESNSVLIYSWKNKVGKLDKHLLEEALETFGVTKASSLLSFGVATKPLLKPTKDGIVSTLAQVEGCQPILRRGFLLPRGTAPSPSEVGKSPRAAFFDDSSWGGDLKELGGPPGAAIDLSLCFQTLVVSHEGNEKDSLDCMALFDLEHRLEAPVSIPKFKGFCEVKNLEGAINYGARGFGSSRARQEGL